MSLLSTRLREERRWSRPRRLTITRSPDLTMTITFDTARFERALVELSRAAARAGRTLGRLPVDRPGREGRP
jgi:hypothetical protein